MRFGYIGMTQDEIECSDFTGDVKFKIVGISYRKDWAIIEYAGEFGMPKLVHAHGKTLKVKE